MKKNTTLNKDGTPRKQGSGRTKGAVSFTNVKMRQLKQLIGDESLVPVSRKWLENMGFDASGGLKPVIEPVAPEQKEDTKISFKLHK